MNNYNFARNVSAKPMVMERAGISAGDPYLIEVTNGQWEGDPSEKTLVIHAQVRPGIPLERAKSVFQHAVIDVFKDQRVPAPRMMDWYDPAEEKARGNRPALAMISLTLIFFPGVITKDDMGQVVKVVKDLDAKTFIATRRTSTIRDLVAAAMGVRHEQLV